MLAVTVCAPSDYAMLAMLFGCGFRRSELVGLELDEIQMRQGHWVVVDLIGKGGHIRTVPIPPPPVTYMKG
jgi:site-specific recombinase XerC